MFVFSNVNSTMACPSRVVSNESVFEIVNNSELKLSESKLSGDNRGDSDVDAPHDLSFDIPIFILW